MLVLVSATRIHPLLIRQIRYGVSSMHVKTPLKLRTDWCCVLQRMTDLYYTELQMITRATSSQRERHERTKYDTCRFHQTERGTQPGIHRAWQREYTSSPTFQEEASGERVDSATLFTVVAEMEKRIK